MNKLHAKLIDPIKFEPKEGQCDDFACSNKKSITHCPSFGYEYVTPPSEEQVNRAFDLLFEEILKIKS
jgi:hypothetical protein